MLANELRIGNYIRSWRINKELRLKQIQSAKDIAFVARDGSNVYEPAELTDDWFMVFGFCKPFTTVGGFERTDKNGFILLDRKLLNKGVPLKYVHQLQNLYFSVTGEELHCV